MRKINDLTGKDFNDLHVIEFIESNNKKTFWLCQCKCGNVVPVRGDHLVSNHTKSCGCIKPEKCGQYVHNMWGTRIYRIWNRMIDRCKNTNNSRWLDYGGRGIQVCKRWELFENFYNDMKEGYSDALTIDRIDNDGNYEPSNCRWVTHKTQSRNMSRNINIEIDGKIQCLMDWCIEYGIKFNTAQARITKGWNPVDAVTTPVKTKV